MPEAVKVQNLVSEMVAPNQATELDAVLAVAATAVSFSESDLATTCKHVRLQVQDAPVRVTYDGSAPTATNGELVHAGERCVLPRRQAILMRWIAATSTAARVWAQPFNTLAH